MRLRKLQTIGLQELIIVNNPMENEQAIFRDDDERKAFLVALPVIALFAGLAYYFVFGSQASLKDSTNIQNALADTDADGIADHIDQCAEQSGSMQNNGCPTHSKQNSKLSSHQVAQQL